LPRREPQPRGGRPALREARLRPRAREGDAEARDEQQLRVRRCEHVADPAEVGGVMSPGAASERPRKASGSGPRPILTPRTTLAGPPPTRANRLRTMPRWLRIVLTGFAFAVFFGGTCVLGLAAGVYYRFRRVRPEDRWRFTQSVNRSLQLFAGFMRDLGLIDYWHPRLPEGFDEGRPFLLVANHPT